MEELYWMVPRKPQALAEQKNMFGILNSAVLSRVKLAKLSETTQVTGGTPEEGSLSLFKSSRNGALKLSRAERHKAAASGEPDRGRPSGMTSNLKSSEPSSDETWSLVMIRL